MVIHKGNVSKIIRHVLALLLAAPIVLGLLASGVAAPCVHGGRPDQSTCPCCDKTILAASMPCLACQAVIEAEADGLQSRFDARQISFAWLDERTDGRAIEPPLPPPRSMAVA